MSRGGGDTCPVWGGTWGHRGALKSQRCCRALGMGQEGLSPHQFITPEAGRGHRKGQSCQPPMGSLGVIGVIQWGVRGGSGGQEVTEGNEGISGLLEGVGRCWEHWDSTTRARGGHWEYLWDAGSCRGDTGGYRGNAMEGTWGPLICLTLLASLWYFTAFLVSATARSTNPTDWSMLFSMRSIMAPYGAPRGHRERGRH